MSTFTFTSTGPSNSADEPRDSHRIDREERWGHVMNECVGIGLRMVQRAREIQEQNIVMEPLKRRSMGERFSWAALAGDVIVHGKRWRKNEKNTGDRLIAPRRNSLKMHRPRIKYLHQMALSALGSYQTRLLSARGVSLQNGR